MKNYVKAIVTFVFLMAAVAFMPAVADAAAVPTGLKQTKATNSYVDFSWDAVPNASTYYTSWSPDGMTWSTGETTYGDPDDTIFNLSAGKTYYVRVASYDKTTSAMSAWSAPLEVVTAPDDKEITAQVTESTTNSISFTWTAASGATSYVLKHSSSDLVLATTTTNSCTVSNLQPGTWYGIDIYPVRTSASGFAAMYSYEHTFTKTLGTTEVSPVTTVVTAPGTPSTANFGIGYASSSSMTVSFRASDPSAKASGYEVEVYKLKGGKKVKTITSATTTTSSMKVSKNTPYKYRIRYYALSNNQKLYGGWSGYRYFCIQKITGKKHYKFTSKYSTIKLKWGKVTGASGYTIYMSTSRDGKYKKVKSLGKNAKGVTLKKYGKSRLNKSKTYYIKVVAKIKVGKKTITNDTQVINYNY